MSQSFYHERKMFGYVRTVTKTVMIYPNLWLVCDEARFGTQLVGLPKPKVVSIACSKTIRFEHVRLEHVKLGRDMSPSHFGSSYISIAPSVRSFYPTRPYPDLGRVGAYYDWLVT